MNDVNIRDLINKIDDPELRNKLTTLYSLIKKYDKLESLSNKIEKLSTQLKKLEKILKSKKYSEMSEEEKKKVNKNVEKVIKYLNQIIQQLSEFTVEPSSEEFNNIDSDSAKDIISQLSDILNQTDKMLPDEVKNKVESQLNELKNMLNNMMKNMVSNSMQQAQQQPITGSGDFQNMLNTLKDNVEKLSSLVNNSNVGPSTKFSGKKIKQLMDKIMNDFNKTGKVDTKTLDELNKHLNAIKNSFVPKSTRDYAKSTQQLADSIKNKALQQELMNVANNLMNGMPDNLKQKLSNFMSNPTKSNYQELVNSIKSSDLPQDKKNELISQTQQLANKLSEFKKNLKKSAIKNLSQALTSLNKIEKNKIPQGLKGDIKSIKQQINQNMFLPDIRSLNSIKESLDNLKNKIKSSNIPNKDNVLDNIENALDNINNAMNNLNNVKQPFSFDFGGKQHQQQCNSNKMKLPMPSLPMPGSSGQQYGGSSGSQGGQQPGMDKAGNFGSQGQQFGNMLNNIMNTLQNALSNAESKLSNEISSLQSVIKQMQGIQGGSSGGTSQQAGSINQPSNQGGLDELLNTLNDINNMIKSGSYSPQAISNYINNLNNLLNSNAIPDSIKPMIQGVKNGLQNLMSLSSLMSNINPVQQSLGTASSSINNVMNSLNSLMNFGGSGSGHNSGVPTGVQGTSGGESSDSSSTDIPSSIFNDNLINMLNMLSSANLTESQRRRFTEIVKKLMKQAIKEAKENSASYNSLLSDSNEKLSKIKAFRNAIKNNLHNMKIDDELLNMAQQLDDAIGDSSMGGGLASGMFASQLHEIEQVDLNEALNKLVQMNAEWIRKYKDLFERLISEIIELKSKEIGQMLNPHGRYIDFNASIRKTIKNAGIISIAKKDVDQAIGDFLFILDASGSMHDVVEMKGVSFYKSKEIKERLNNRLKQYQVGLITAYVLGEAIRRVGEGDYYIIVFADKMVDLSNAPLETILYLIQNPEELNKYIGAGTNLAPVILKIINSYLNNDINVVLFTDTGDESVWNTFILEKMKENSKKVAVFCSGDFFEDTARAFTKAGIPVFSFTSFDDLFELMKQYYIADLTPEQAVLEAKEYLKMKKDKSTLSGLVPENV